MLHVVAADGEQLPSSGWLLVVSSSVSRRCLSTVVARWSRHYQVNSPHMDDVLLNIVHMWTKSLLVSAINTQRRRTCDTHCSAAVCRCSLLILVCPARQLEIRADPTLFLPRSVRYSVIADGHRSCRSYVLL